MSETPQEFGRRFEVEWAKEIGGKTTPASGATFHTKLDVHDRHVLWSLKATTKKSISITQDMIDELDQTLTGSGGVGTDKIAAMALRIGDPKYDLVVLTKADFMRLVKSDLAYVRETKIEAKRRRGNTPGLFRDLES